MTIKFLLLVNKQGQTRLAKYFTELLSTDEKRALEGEIVRKCLARTDRQVRGAGAGRSVNFSVKPPEFRPMHSSQPASHQRMHMRYKQLASNQCMRYVSAWNGVPKGSSFF